MTMIYKVLFGCVVVYLALLLVVFLFQRKLMYHPDLHVRTGHQDESPELKKVMLKTKDGLTLESFYRAPKTKENGEKYPTVMYFHGNTGPASDAAHKVIALADAGYGIFMQEYRGFGDNDGKPTEQGLILDAIAGVDFLRQELGAKAEIIYYGMSMGTGVANGLAEQIPPTAMILECGFTSMADAGQVHYPMFPVKWLIKDTFDSENRIKSYQQPLLVVHGSLDKTVPVEQGQKVFDSAQSQDKTLKIYPTAGHINLFDHGSSEFILEWLNQRFAN